MKKTGTTTNEAGQETIFILPPDTSRRMGREEKEKSKAL